MTLADQIEIDGYAVVENVLSVEELAAAVRALDELGAQPGRAGWRNTARDIPEIAALAMTPRLHALAHLVMGREAFISRVLIFEKSAAANWSIGWHQDVAIAVKERINVTGFNGWSVKAGVPHVHPPAHVLQNMLTLRLHLDDCGAENGPVRVLPGSHCDKRLTNPEIESFRAQSTEIVCTSGAGGVLIMRPLLVHASSPAAAPNHRRVLHLEFANESLPGGLEWYERLRPAEMRKEVLAGGPQPEAERV